MVKPIFILFLSSFFVVLSSAQFNQTQTFTYTDGLAMSECNTVYCDRDGRIWVNHASGWLSCFNGRNFTLYSPDDIGYHGEGLQFAEDYIGLWVMMNHSVSLFRNGHWRSWETSFTQKILVNKETDQMIILDREGKLWQMDTLQWLLVNHAQLPQQLPESKFDLVASRFENKYLLIQWDNTKDWRIHKTFVSPSLIHPVWKEAAAFLHPDLEWGFSFSTEDQFTHFNLVLPKSRKGIVHEFFEYSNNILFYGQSSSDQFSPGFIIDVYTVDSSMQFHHFVSFRNTHQNVSVALDKSGDLWVASQAGLMRVFPDLLQCFENNHNMVPSLHCINEDDIGRIWFGGYTTGLCYFENDKLFPPPPGAAKYKSFLPGSYRDEKGNMGFWTEDYYLVTYHDGLWRDAKTKKAEAQREVGYCFLPLRNHQIAAGFQSFGLGITNVPLTENSDWTFISKEKGMLLDNVLTIAEDSKGRLWLGRPSQGIALYDPQLDTARTWLLKLDTARTWLLKSGNGVDYGMMSSVTDPNGRLWMGCTDGLYVMDHPDSFDLFYDELSAKTHKLILDEAGYSTVTFMKVYNHMLVFGNSIGYGFLDLDSYAVNPEMPKIFFYNTSSYGGSCEQNAILPDSKGYIWVGLDKSATRIDPRYHSFDTLPTYLISKNITIREQAGKTTSLNIDSTLYLKLPPKKRSFTIHLEPSFTGLLNDNTGIQYRLVNKNIHDTLWSSYSRDFDIRVDYLPPKESKMEVRAIKNNQVVDTISITLWSPPYLDERPSFWILLIGSFSLLGFLFTRRIHRQRLRIKETEIALSEQRREKEQFQIRAIANSLNPHFIKNSLNWIQTRFRTDSEVVDVIDRLSENIGTVFTHSRNGEAFHSLPDEMKLVDNYLSIQQATYRNFLSLSMPPKETISAWSKVMVPLLQVQIHVENAIEHGLRKSTNHRELKIAIKESEDFLHIIISDNGIGRTASKAMGSNSTKQGTSMLQSVHNIFNAQNQHHFSTEYDDLVDPLTGKSSGTQVIINVPKQYKIQIL
ncbi:MAG: histidine kinase [Saprospiraceae bacterium]